jgi:hypothetical protein
VLDVGAPGSPPPSRAAVVAKLAAGAVDGRSEDVLDACIRLTEDADVLAVPPGAVPLAEALAEITAR